MSMVDKLTEKLQVLEPEQLDIQDESDGCGAKMRIEIVSKNFVGLSTINSHRLVQEKMAELLPQIHAVTIKTYTPEKYAARNQ